MNKLIFEYLIIALISVSCTSIETLKKTKIQSDEFHVELFNQYRDFAEKEAEKYDWLDSQYFIDKAMLIAYGKSVAPEMVSNWKIDKKFVSDLESKRSTLVTLLKNKKLYLSNPKDLAQAQFSYDCLLEELEEGWQNDDINQCKTIFDEKITLLKNQISPPKKPTESKNQPKLDDKTPAISKKQEIYPINKTNSDKNSHNSDIQKKILSKSKEFFSYRIFFEFDSANLTEGSKNSLKSIAQEILKTKPIPEEIILNGYTDRTGVEEYNLALSKRRASTVKNYLISLGIPKDKIIIFAFGESDNAIDSSNGVKEPGSRRVEISIVD